MLQVHIPDLTVYTLRQYQMYIPESVVYLWRNMTILVHSWSRLLHNVTVTYVASSHSWLNCLHNETIPDVARVHSWISCLLMTQYGNKRTLYQFVHSWSSLLHNGTVTPGGRYGTQIWFGRGGGCHSGLKTCQTRGVSD